MELDAIARRYHTDPWTVLGWPPERVAMAALAMRAANEETGRRIRDSRASLTYTIEV